MDCRDTCRGPSQKDRKKNVGLLVPECGKLGKRQRKKDTKYLSEGDGGNIGKEIWEVRCVEVFREGKIQLKGRKQPKEKCGLSKR